MNIEQVNYTDKDLITFLGQQESQDIRWGHEYTGELLDRVRDGQVLIGSKLPWSDTHNLIRFRPGEVTIHAGRNGNKKSMVTGQIMLWFALHGEKCGIASFEMPVVETMYRMCRQAAGTKSPAPLFTQRWGEWNEQNLAYYDKLDTTKSDKVLGAVFYMAKDMGCKHILIDSLTKCGLPVGDRQAEKDFIDALCATAKSFKIHIHLICHVRKTTPVSGGFPPPPNKDDVRGAGELTDLVHNVIMHHSDKKKESLLERLAHPDPRVHKLTADETDYVQTKSDQLMIVEKQRSGAFEGKIGLDFHESLQFNKGKLLPFDLPEITHAA